MTTCLPFSRCAGLCTRSSWRPRRCARTPGLFAIIAMISSNQCMRGRCCSVVHVWLSVPVLLLILQTLIEGYRLGDPLKDGTTLGPLALPQAPAFLHNQVLDAVAKVRLKYEGGSGVALCALVPFCLPSPVPVLHTSGTLAIVSVSCMCGCAGMFSCI
jgi:hypothetical protein